MKRNVLNYHSMMDEAIAYDPDFSEWCAVQDRKDMEAMALDYERGYFAVEDWNDRYIDYSEGWFDFENDDNGQAYDEWCEKERNRTLETQGDMLASCIPDDEYYPF